MLNHICSGVKSKALGAWVTAQLCTVEADTERCGRTIGDTSRIQPLVYRIELHSDVQGFRPCS
jgi:hypothetical protein